MALSVEQDDADRSQAALDEMIEIFENGAVVGVTEVVEAICDPGEYAPPGQLTGAHFVEAIALAMVRLSKNGTSVYPTRLPPYSSASLPSASSYEGCMIYVSDLKVAAWSDGTSWLSCADGSPV